MQDTNGREWAKLSELKLGDFVEVIGFDCMDGTRKVRFDSGEPYIDCDHGHHFLSGQLETDGDSLIGIYKIGA